MLFVSCSAWYGIEQADVENSCRVSNSSRDCIPELSIGPAAPVSSPGPLTEGFNYDLYLYWMAGASVCGLVWAFINVLTLVAFSELIRTHLVLFEKAEREVIDG